MVETVQGQYLELNCIVQYKRYKKLVLLHNKVLLCIYTCYLLSVYKLIICFTLISTKHQHYHNASIQSTQPNTPETVSIQQYAKNLISSIRIDTVSITTTAVPIYNPATPLFTVWYSQLMDYIVLNKIIHDSQLLHILQQSVTGTAMLQRYIHKHNSNVTYEQCIEILKRRYCSEPIEQCSNNNNSKLPHQCISPIVGAQAPAVAIINGVSNTYIDKLCSIPCTIMNTTEWTRQQFHYNDTDIHDIRQLNNLFLQSCNYMTDAYMYGRQRDTLSDTVIQPSLSCYIKSGLNTAAHLQCWPRDINCTYTPMPCSAECEKLCKLLTEYYSLEQCGEYKLAAQELVYIEYSILLQRANKNVLQGHTCMLNSIECNRHRVPIYDRNVVEHVPHITMYMLFTGANTNYIISM